MIDNKFDLKILNQSENNKVWFNKSREEFYDSFLNHILFLINKDNNLEIKNFSNPLESSRDIFKEIELSIENIKFEYFDFSFTQFLILFKSVNFTNCTFTVKQIEIESNISFNKCLFNNEEKQLNLICKQCHKE